LGNKVRTVAIELKKIRQKAIILVYVQSVIIQDILKVCLGVDFDGCICGPYLWVMTFMVCGCVVQEMLKCSKGQGTVELEEALATMLDIIKSVNDSMHQIAITGFEVGVPRITAFTLHLPPSLPPSLPPVHSSPSGCSI